MGRISYGLIAIVLLTSCKQWKSITTKDTSTYRPAPRSKSAKKVQFLEDISVTPGQVVTSKHATPTSDVPRHGKSMIYPQTVNDIPGSPERTTYLQIKYAGFLNSVPEKMTNVSLLSLIDEWWGTKYCIGGNSRDCLDCSAFTQMLAKNIYQAQLPRTAQEQYNACEKVATEEMQEGNLVFFHTQGRAISHVGVYLTNNKFVHVSTSQGVMINDLDDNYWKNKFRGAGKFN